MGRLIEWILCSERLPQNDGKYLVTTTYGSIDICNYTHDLFKVDECDFSEYEFKKINQVGMSMTASGVTAKGLIR